MYEYDTFVGRRTMFIFAFYCTVELTQRSNKHKSLNLTKSYRKIDKYVHSNIEILVLSVSLYFPRSFLDMNIL